MPNIRPLNEKKYNISKYRFMEIYYYCLQYNEWKDELKYNKTTVASPVISDMPTAHSNESATERLAIRRAELQKKVDMIEETAKEVDDFLAPYLIKAVTNKGVSFEYLREIMRIPCSNHIYYNARRQFYFLMDKKLKEREFK